MGEWCSIAEPRPVYDMWHQVPHCAPAALLLCSVIHVPSQFCMSVAMFRSNCHLHKARVSTPRWVGECIYACTHPNCAAAAATRPSIYSRTTRAHMPRPLTPGRPITAHRGPIDRPNHAAVGIRQSPDPPCATHQPTTTAGAIGYIFSGNHVTSANLRFSNLAGAPRLGELAFRISRVHPNHRRTSE